MIAPSHSRYSRVAIIIHWLIALLLAWNIWVGWWMTDNLENPSAAASVFKAYQFHKSLGLTVLVLTLLRLIWRLTHRPPALPAHMPGWERLAARAGHAGLYLLMIALPLTGWLYVSAGWNADRGVPFPVPTIWFGFFEWPHIPGLQTLPDPARGSAAGAAMEAHELLVWIAIALVVLHVAAALKHHIIDRDDVLTRMLPFLRPRRAASQETLP